MTGLTLGAGPRMGEPVMIEYSSPNTNKPLHLGHLRNNFLGGASQQIYKANGYDVVKTCIANDRGIHICKSMVSPGSGLRAARPRPARVSKAIISSGIITSFSRTNIKRRWNH